MSPHRLDPPSPLAEPIKAAATAWQHWDAHPMSQVPSVGFEDAAQRLARAAGLPTSALRAALVDLSRRAFPDGLAKATLPERISVIQEAIEELMP
ncbi:MAG: hypothetical protein ACYCST_11210 [Acidimicrobiales bacterium]